MSNVKNLVLELEEEVRDLLRTKGTAVVVRTYGAPEGLTEEELVEFCVGVEYENAFK